MNNRAIKKLLSVVLVMAICVSAVFGCLITVNAADTAATYTITAESLFAYADEGKATVTFELGSGFTSGSFTLLKNDNISHSEDYILDANGNKVIPSPWDYEYNDVEVKVVGGTKADGTVVTADEMNIELFYDTNKDNKNDLEQQTETTDILCPNNVLWFNAAGEYKDAEGNNFSFSPEAGTVYRHKDYKLSDVTFDSGEVAYKSITLELNLEFAYCMQPNSQNYIRIANSTQEDQDGNSYSDPVLTLNGATVGTLSENVVEGNVNYLHSHASIDVKAYGQLVQQNDYSIYTDKCRFCGVVKNQLLSDELTSNQPNAYYDISAMNIVYEDDGTVSLNLHCPGFQGVKEKLVISYSDGTKTIYGDNKTSEIAGNSSFKVSPYAKDKITDEETGKFTYSDNVLPHGTYMYEIKGLSAKDIESKFYLTRVVKGSGQWEGGTFCGHTQEVSLSDYCTDVVEGEKVYYPAGTTAEQIAADKAVAVAFINYGVAAANALNHKVSYEKEEITVTDTWDGTMVEPTTTDELGNIVINTAEELAWVALGSGTATAGKNYKVAANSVFNLNGMDSITLNSTAAQVKTAGDAKVTANDVANAWRTLADDQSNAFRGNFDGNGLIVYNLYTAKGRGYSGLFPFAKPATADTPQVIKNVAVYASHIGGYHYAGGIVGLAECNTTSSIVNFENCIVKNCYIYDNNDTTSTPNKTVGAIVGGLSHNGTTLNNCAAYDNKLSGQGVTGGLIGNKSLYGGSVTIQNSFSIGTSVLPTSGTKEVSSKITGATYKNVYTDVSTSVTGISTLDTANMKGSAAETNMSALDWDSTWVTTDTYPEFNPDVYCSDVWDGTKVEPTATDADGNVIIGTAEELAWVALSGGSATANKNYKVADGIKYFNMNGMTGITLDSTAEQVKAATKNGSCLWANDSNYFMGNFDGNGVTVYNINAAVAGSYAYTGLFTVVKPENDAKEINIKNVTVAASYFEGFHYTGGIIGFAQNQSANTGCINVGSCATKNCYFYDTVRTHNSTSGLIIGQINHNSGNVSNCLAINNISDTAKINGGIVGTSSDYISTQTVSNCVVIGSLPYSTVVEGSGGKVGTRIQNATVTNVYTDQTSTDSKYTTLTTAQMTGDAAKDNMALAWGADWFEGKDGEYPSINGEVYADTWDGTKVEPTTTDSEGNIIINTAEELAWVILQGGTATQDKNYKVADGMKYFNMNGMTGITLDSTASEVQAATKDSSKNWVNGSNYFMGNFDGNGVTVYNVYGNGAGSYGYGGLFPIAKQTADGDSITIKNIKVCASYFTAYHGVGAVIGYINAPGTSCTATLEKLSAENCYLSDNANTNAACHRTVANIVGLVGHTKLTMNNCFAAGNTLSAANIVGGLVGNTSAFSKGVTISNSIVIGTSPIPVELLTTDNHGLQSIMSNATYTNIYTDQATSQAGITVIDADDAKGAGADAAMPNLGWDIDWFTGALGEYPSFVDDGVQYVSDEIEALLVANGYYSDFVANFENNYKRDSFTTNDENCNFYATGLTLKTNPYMTVTLVLHDTYRTNKANVEAVFTVGDQTITVKGSEMVNNANAGRYHMVRLKDIKIMNLCDDITVTLNYNGSQVGTGSISVAGFAFTAADAGEGFEYYETAAQALVFYAEALQNRYAARNAVQ